MIVVVEDWEDLVERHHLVELERKHSDMYIYTEGFVPHINCSIGPKLQLRQLYSNKTRDRYICIPVLTVITQCTGTIACIHNIVL